MATGKAVDKDHSLQNKEATQTVSTLAQEGTCLIWLTEIIGKGQIVFGRKSPPHFSTGLLPFFKALLKLILCDGSEIFSYCLSLFFIFFSCVFLDCGQNGNRLLNTAKKAVLKVLPCHLKARSAVNLELTCTRNLETCWQCTSSVLPGITTDYSCISRSHLTRAGPQVSR